jgi:hypothetical protein
MASVFPLFGAAFFKNLGVGPGSSLLAGISIVLMIGYAVRHIFRYFQAAVNPLSCLPAPDKIWRQIARSLPICTDIIRGCIEVSVYTGVERLFQASDGSRDRLCDVEAMCILFKNAQYVYRYR